VGTLAKEYFESVFEVDGISLKEMNNRLLLRAGAQLFISSPRNAPSLIESKESVPCSY
jgi:hypothetical protein